MNQRLICFFLSIVFFCCGYAQNNNTTDDKTKHVQDSLQAAIKDSLRMVKLESIAYYPIIKAGTWSGVLPVEKIDEKPDPALHYKLLFEITMNPKDSVEGGINAGLVEIARIINLHVAAGIPEDHIHPVILTHGSALFSFLNNEAFKVKYKRANPNIVVLDKLSQHGAQFIACGQAMGFFDISKEQLWEKVKVALTAKVVLSSYIGKGYVLYDISTLK